MKHTEHVVDYKLLEVTSPVFSAAEMIPARYTCDGINVNPPLYINKIPNEAKSLALIMEDPDAPSGVWLHWLAWNIPVTHHLKENEVHGTTGKNDFGNNNYGGPCPPGGTHRYYFKVYALDTLLMLPPNASKPALEKAMAGHILAFGQLMGKYKAL